MKRGTIRVVKYSSGPVDGGDELCYLELRRESSLYVLGFNMEIGLGSG